MNRQWNWLDSLKDSKILWWILLIFGAIFYLRQYMANRALWADESSLALNLIQRNFIGLTQPLDYHQAAPVGFMFIVKFFVTLFGNSEYSLRLFPLLAGVLSTYFLYRLAREHFGMAGMVAVLFVAGNVWLNTYATELKQYIGDVFFALLLTYLAVNCFREPANKRDFLYLWIAGMIAVWFSHVSIFILAGIGISLVIEKILRKNRVPFLWIFGLGAGWLLSFGLHYVLILQYTAADDYFLTYWRRAFAPVPPWTDLHWYLRTYYVFLLTLFNRTDLILFYLAPIMAALGLISLFIRNRALALLMLFPFLMILIASALQKYPLTYRFMIFLIPFVFLLIAECVGWMYRTISKWDRGLALAASLVPVVVMLWYTIPSTFTRFRSPYLTPDIRVVIDYVGKNRRPDDIIYVYYGSKPTFYYYAPLYGLESGHIVVQQDEVKKKKGHDNFFIGVEHLKGNDRVWVIISDIIDCGGCDGNMLDYFAGSLNAYGIRLDAIETSTQAGGYLYDLNP